MPDDDHSAISASDAKILFAEWKAAPALVLAVSGGPDSVALLWLMARWRRALRRGPRLIAVTVDHGLRAASAREADDVKRLAPAILGHRLIVRPESRLRKVRSVDVVQEVLAETAVPTLSSGQSAS